MPLLDHFRPPLHPRRSGESLHAAWSTTRMFHLNETLLPPGYYSDTQVHIGSRVERDGATLEESADNGTPSQNGGSATAIAEAMWAPPLVLSTALPGEIEVQVFGSRTGAHLVAAIELVCPAN